MSDLRPIILSGAPEGYDAALLLRELDTSASPTVHIARDARRLAAMEAGLDFFAPDVPRIVFPGWDCLPYDRVSPNPDVSATRMATLAALVKGMPTQRFVLLTTLSAATQKLPAREVLSEASFTARVGDRLDVAALRAFLVRMGFSQAPTVTEPGDFAVRGGIIDIFPPGEAGPVRLDLFGDVLDGARRFDPVSQRTTETLSVVELAPVSEVILDEAAITRFRQNYRIAFGAGTSDDPLYEAVSAGRKAQGAEHWLPFFHERLETLFDYLPGASVVLDDQFTPARVSRWEGIADQYDTRLEAMKLKARVDSVYKPCPPDQLYLDDAGWEKALGGRRVIELSVLPRPTGVGVLDAGGRIGRNFSPERQIEKVNLFDVLADHVRAKRESGSVVVASYS
ncbi:MAG TPA: transcription-repair coupling factor, partial [Rhodobacterales bacterium]|nr:transcription-repair coupling factor [Rhodobacterales bacterium]